MPASGWWALPVQNIGLTDAVAVRYDYFDYENGVSSDRGRPQARHQQRRGHAGPAAMHYFGENLKVSAAYEHPMTDTVSTATPRTRKDNLFTLQLQARF